jgi:hypothetical protein
LLNNYKMNHYLTICRNEINDFTKQNKSETYLLLTVPAELRSEIHKVLALENKHLSLRLVEETEYGPIVYPMLTEKEILSGQHITVVRKLCYGPPPL